jgi:TorA maturation chaperone TorD
MTSSDNDKATAREDLCRYLSACYYEPGVEFTEERLFDSMLAAARVLDPDLAESARKLGAAFLAHDLQTLLVDHTRLFIGPSQPLAMPYASFWLGADASMRHEATTAVLELYERGGFEVSDDFRDLPDHIAVELEFLYLLIFSRNPARLEGDPDAVAVADTLRQRFVNRHLAAWVDRFAAAVRANAETGFYRELADMTEGFVRLEADAP